MKFKIENSKFLPHIGCAINFDVAKGEILVLKGENGVGKSTLAKELFKSHSLSLVAQEDSDLFYDRNVGRVKKLFVESSKGILNEKLFEKYWNLFGLSKKEDRFLSALSGGEAQMLKICLGAFLERESILLDEPSQNLDENMKDVLNDLITDLRHKAVIIIEHDSNWLKQDVKVIRLIVRNKVLAGES